MRLYLNDGKSFFRDEGKIRLYDCLFSNMNIKWCSIDATHVPGIDMW